MPFYMRGPGIPAGVSLSHPTTHVDLAATLLDLAGMALAPFPSPTPSFTPPHPTRLTSTSAGVAPPAGVRLDGLSFKVRRAGSRRPHN